jgi:hypothetical protein
MRVQEISHHARLRPLKLSARETPHVTIEPTTKCNIQCARCYSIEKATTKTLAEVQGEIDLACIKRNVGTISLLGGEPTVHPDIVEIVRYVKQKGIVCQLLTNGVRFVRDGNDALLDALVQAGVDRFLVHIDSGQKHVYGDTECAREAMFSKLDARHVCYGLSMTLYAGEESTLPAVMKRYARHRYFDGVLCTLAFDLDRALTPESPGRAEPSMSAVHQALRDGMGLEPAAYLPSNLDDANVCWLIYLYFLDAETGATFGVSPELNRLLKAVFRILRHHQFFAEVTDPKRVPLMLAGAAAFELMLDVTRFRRLVRLVRGVARSHSLRFHFIAVQQMPRYDAQAGRVELCWRCPDATIRNGKLTPVCIAGWVNPVGGWPARAPLEVVNQVFEHLEGD